MPFILPTTPFTFSRPFFPGRVQRQAAFTSAGMGRLDASLVANEPFGQATTTTGLGGSVGAAPGGSLFLDVSATVASIENALVAVLAPTMPPGIAESRATLEIFVQEFTAAGSFLRSVPGPRTVVFEDSRIFIPGVHLHVDERRTPSSSIHMPVVGGRRYVVWLLSRQFVNAISVSPAGASALSDFTYDFGPLFFVFS